MGYLSDWREAEEHEAAVRAAHPDCDKSRTCPADDHVGECLTFRLAVAMAKRERMRVESGCQNPEWCGYHRCVSDCPALIHHGPGHQSKTHCDLKGPHDQHHAEVMREVVLWHGLNASTGFFDESPE